MYRKDLSERQIAIIRNVNRKIRNLCAPAITKVNDTFYDNKNNDTKGN